MPTEKPLGRRIALRRPTDAGIAAELLTLLETVTTDGTITDDEARELQSWLKDNRQSELPSIEFLSTTLEQILADGRITDEERHTLHIAVERVLPPELRQRVKAVRTAKELIEKTRKREETAERRAKERDERTRNACVYSGNFMVAGVLYEGRAAVVSQFVRTGEVVFLARDPTNQYDANAIQVRTRDGYQVGFVPRDYAREMARFLDSGFRHGAYCTKILEGRKAQIPVVQADLYRPEASLPGVVTPAEVPPSRTAPTKNSRRGCGCLTATVLGLVGILAILWAVMSSL